MHARHQRTYVRHRRFRSRLGALAACLCAATLVACAGGKYPPPPSDGGAIGDGETPFVYDYVIGKGDLLNIFVWGYDDLSVTVPVRPDGRITTRLVEDLQASGRTPTELAREIEKRYTEFVNRPVVTVSVDNFIGSSTQQIKVIRAGAEPTTVPFASGMTVLDLVIAVGGIGEYASGNRAVLVRNQEGERQNFTLRLDDLIRKGDLSADVPLRPGDIVVIPETWF